MALAGTLFRKLRWVSPFLMLAVAVRIHLGLPFHSQWPPF
jgi:hypothetical protein